MERNYKITKMYAEYLERYPELIKAEMIDELTSDGCITREEALVALLSEIFALDDARGGDDRILIRRITPVIAITEISLPRKQGSEIGR